jgi:hypothetical protein
MGEEAVVITFEELSNHLPERTEESYEIHQSK